MPRAKPFDSRFQSDALVEHEADPTGRDMDREAPLSRLIALAMAFAYIGFLVFVTVEMVD